MPANKGRRVASAAGFLSGVITCLDAIRDARVSWPPDVVWEVLRRPQKVELCGGIALIAVTLIMSVAAARNNEQTS
jgi:hypothetical protein